MQSLLPVIGSLFSKVAGSLFGGGNDTSTPAVPEAPNTEAIDASAASEDARRRRLNTMRNSTATAGAGGLGTIPSVSVLG